MPKVSSKDFERAKDLLKSKYKNKWNKGIETVLKNCFQEPTLLFSKSFLNEKSFDLAIEKWANKYFKGFENRLSKRKSNKPGTVPDNSVDILLRARLKHLTKEDLHLIKHAHRISMSAENIAGRFLEEYLATKLEKYGWYCCWGETMNKVDFCTPDFKLLQIKNSDNSENSSSSTVRRDTEISVWQRRNAKKGTYYWDELNKMLNISDELSEEGFCEFINDIVAQNPDVLFVERENPWGSKK